MSGVAWEELVWWERGGWGQRDGLWRSPPPGWELLDFISAVESIRDFKLSWWKAGWPCWRTFCQGMRWCERDNWEDEVSANSFYLPELYRLLQQHYVCWMPSVFQEVHKPVPDRVRCFLIFFFHCLLCKNTACPTSDLCRSVISGRGGCHVFFIQLNSSLLQNK